MSVHTKGTWAVENLCPIIPQTFLWNWNLALFFTEQGSLVKCPAYAGVAALSKGIQTINGSNYAETERRLDSHLLLAFFFRESQGERNIFPSDPGSTIVHTMYLEQ